MLEHAKRIAKRWKQTTASAKIPLLLDRIAARAPVESNPRSSIVLVPATGNGNIGDRAMLEAALRRLSSERVILAVEHAESIGHVPAHAHVVQLPGLLSEVGWRRYRAHQSYARLCDSAKSVVVVGADLVDGLYNARRSIARYSILQTAIARGAEARVLGFSWPHEPAKNAAHMARVLSPYVDFCLRDPVSYQRFTDSGSAARATADVVFSDTHTNDPSELIMTWMESSQSTGGFVVVNLSGLIERRIPQMEEYRAIVNAAHGGGLRVLFLPHVVRTFDGDLEPVRRAFEQLGRSDDMFVPYELSPSEIRAVARRAVATVTGRMHLAIMSLSQGTPAITLATQGKVEGLYSMFELEQFCVPPVPGFGREVARQLDSDSIAAARLAIRSALADVRRLSESTFSSNPVP
jgi:colanic acid/amylovoran biosynthesis protein